MRHAFWLFLLLMIPDLIPAAENANGFTVVPCPEPKPTFDATRMKRDLREPTYGGKPVYLFLALGPEGKQVVAVVADESRGEGKGVDRLYIDLNANGDITEAGECFKPEEPGKMSQKRPDRGKGHAATPNQVTITGQSRFVSDRKLAITDPALEYVLDFGFSFNNLKVTARDGSYKETWHFVTTWSTDKSKALVIRAGGSEFTLAHNNFVPKVDGELDLQPDVGRTLKPGMEIEALATTPFFAGSTHGGYVHWGNRSLRVWLEHRNDGQDCRLDIPLHES